MEGGLDHIGQLPGHIGGEVPAIRRIVVEAELTAGHHGDKAVFAAPGLHIRPLDPLKSIAPGPMEHIDHGPLAGGVIGVLVLDHIL